MPTTKTTCTSCDRRFLAGCSVPYSLDPDGARVPTPTDRCPVCLVDAGYRSASRPVVINGRPR